MRTALPVYLLSLSITLLSSNVVAEKPQRIVSLSLCIDQILLMLVEKNRIAALSHLAMDKTYSYMWEASEGINTHNNLAEEIVPLKPDLVISSSFSTGNTRQMLESLGHKVVTVATPQTLKEVEQLTRIIGKAVNESERAESLIRELQNDIIKAKTLVANKPQLRAISYGPNGFTAGKHTIKNEILQAAGYRNIAADIGIEYFGNVPLEQLVLYNPDVVILDEDIPNQHSLAQISVNHPVLNRLLKNKPRPTLPTSFWICPGPIAGKAILALIKQRQ